MPPGPEGTRIAANLPGTDRSPVRKFTVNKTERPEPLAHNELAERERVIVKPAPQCGRTDLGGEQQARRRERAGRNDDGIRRDALLAAVSRHVHGGDATGAVFESHGARARAQREAPGVAAEAGEDVGGGGEVDAALAVRTPRQRQTRDATAGRDRAGEVCGQTRGDPRCRSEP